MPGRRTAEDVEVPSMDSSILEHGAHSLARDAVSRRRMAHSRLLGISLPRHTVWNIRETGYPLSARGRSGDALNSSDRRGIGLWKDRLGVWMQGRNLPRDNARTHRAGKDEWGRDFFVFHGLARWAGRKERTVCRKPQSTINSLTERKLTNGISTGVRIQS